MVFPTQKWRMDHGSKAERHCAQELNGTDMQPLSNKAQSLTKWRRMVTSEEIPTYLYLFAILGAVRNAPTPRTGYLLHFEQTGFIGVLDSLQGHI